MVETSSEIDGLCEALETRYRKNERANAAALGNIILEKYTPVGSDKYINFFSFFESFTEAVLRKDMKDIVKLDYLKKSVAGEALDAIRAYTHGDQLQEALKVLQDLYSKPQLIVAEVYSNLRNMPTIDSFKNMTKAKEQVQTLQMAIATFKSLGLEKELTTDTNFQNTYILGDIENKVPIETKIKWFEVKSEMRAKDKEPNLKDFSEFYQKLVYSVHEAQYMRTALEGINSNNDANKKVKHKNDDSKVEKRNLLATHTKSSKNKEQQGKSNENKTNSKEEKNSNLPQRGKFLKCYCYFCNSVGHSPNFCKGFKLKFEEKKEIALKHNACILCLKVDGHKSKDCSFEIKSCSICGQEHNMNLHSQSEKIKYFKEKKSGGNVRRD